VTGSESPSDLGAEVGIDRSRLIPMSSTKAVCGRPAAAFSPIALSSPVKAADDIDHGLELDLKGTILTV
jgi:hypothetical protein